ncbi:MAG: hypothetical protein ACXIU7_08165 [Roseinatronobacter sp.]
MKTKLAVVASLCAFAAAPLLAETGHDFPLSMDEFMAAYPEVMAEEFALIDSDGDGQISEEEYLSAQEMGFITSAAEHDETGAVSAD